MDADSPLMLISEGKYILQLVFHASQVICAQVLCAGLTTYIKQKG